MPILILKSLDADNSAIKGPSLKEETFVPIGDLAVTDTEGPRVDVMDTLGQAVEVMDGAAVVEVYDTPA